MLSLYEYIDIQEQTEQLLELREKKREGKRTRQTINKKKRRNEMK